MYEYEDLLEELLLEKLAEEELEDILFEEMLKEAAASEYLRRVKEFLLRPYVIGPLGGLTAGLGGYLLGRAIAGPRVAGLTPLPEELFY